MKIRKIDETQNQSASEKLKSLKYYLITLHSEKVESFSLRFLYCKRKCYLNSQLDAIFKGSMQYTLLPRSIMGN